MSAILRECPHCAGENQFFRGVHEWRHRKSYKGKHRYEVIFKCDYCDGAFVISCLKSIGNSPLASSVNFDEIADLCIENEYPKMPPIDCPASTPKNVATIFLEARDSERRRNWDSAGMAGRRVLELATKALRPDDDGFKSKTLFERIDFLAMKHEITHAMKSWAHAVRDDGNAASHDENEYTEREVEQLLAFAEAFLMYAFTLPAMVEKRHRDETAE